MDTWTKADRQGLGARATGLLEEQVFPVHSLTQSLGWQGLVPVTRRGSHLHRDWEACRILGHTSPSCLLPCDMAKS